MDALSALSMMGGPDLGTKLNSVVKDAGAKSISPAELQQLNPDLAASSAMPAITATGSSDSFSNLLGSFVNEVNQKQAAASDAVSGLLSGKNVSLHQAMISSEEASVSFSMMVEVRNKLLDSYQELMRMQI